MDPISRVEVVRSRRSRPTALARGALALVAFALLATPASVVSAGGETSVDDQAAANGGPQLRSEAPKDTDQPAGGDEEQLLPGGEHRGRAALDQPAREMPEPALRGVFERPSRGHAAIEELGDRLPLAARANGMRVDELRRLLIDDEAAYLDRDGMLFFAEPDPDSSMTEAEPVLAASATFDYDQTFKLHSRPGSQRTIYLDFDGHRISGTVWQANGAPEPFVAAAFDPARDGSDFSARDHDAIQDIWKRVAEDYAPFDVDVTTEDPGEAAIRRSSTTDQVYGTRVVITSSESICSTSRTGCAYRGVIDFTGTNHDYYQPAFSFAPGLGHDIKNVAEVTSHEAGHVLGLSHDGPGADGSEYYRGHGVWAPIMGSGYQRPLVQFSQGENAGATNDEDDIAMMAANGISVRADDHTNAMSTATPLTSSATGVIATYEASGGGRTSDLDAFKFTAPASGTATFTAEPAEVSPNLDVVMKLFADDGSTLLASDNPDVAWISRDEASGLSASFSHDVVAGQVYYLQIGASGFQTASNGYTQYGSMGQYRVTVEAPSVEAPANDDFDAAAVLQGTSGTASGSNVGSSGEAGEPDHAGSDPSTSVWWSFTAPGDGVLHVDTEGSAFDTVVAVYTGDSVSALTEVAANDDHPDAGEGSRWSVVDTQVDAGVTYRIAVDGWRSAEGAITLNWSHTQAAPSTGQLRITTNPAVPARVFVDGLPRNDWGLEWLTIGAGQHEVCFSDIPGFTTPPCEVFVVDAGTTRVVVGEYTQLGLLKVEVSPAGLASTVFVDGEPRQEYGLFSFFEAGVHTVCWGDAPGFQAPDCEVVEVEPGAQTTVRGTFVASSDPSVGPAPTMGAHGYLRVTTTPAVASRIIVDGVPRSDWALEWVKFPVGDHEVCFTDVVGYSAPPCQTITVAEGRTAVVEGGFRQLGLLKVEILPAGLPVDVMIDGIGRNQYGMYAWMEDADYEVCGVPIESWGTPTCETVTVAAGVETVVTLTYSPE